MIEKSKQYTIINIYNNQLMVIKDKNGQYYLPQEGVYNIRKEHNITKYRIGKVFTDKWFTQMDKTAQNKIKEITFITNSSNFYIYISDVKLNYPKAEYLHIDFLLTCSFSPKCYPFLFGIITKQLQLEEENLKTIKGYSPFEKTQNLNFEKWISWITASIHQGSYSSSQKIIKVFLGKTTAMLSYTKMLNSKPFKELIQKAEYIIQYTQNIFESLLSKYDKDIFTHIEYCLNYGICSSNDILYYAKTTSNQELKSDTLYSYFLRTKDQDALSNYIFYLTETNDKETKKELERLLSLNLLQSSKKTTFIISHLFHACYLILKNNYQEAFEELVDCYLNNYFNEANSERLILSSISLYRSIPVNYKYMMLFLIQSIYDLNLAEFIDGTTILNNILLDYTAMLNDTNADKRIKNYYLKETLNKFKKHRTININKMNEKEKVIFALKNMSFQEFQKIKNLIHNEVSPKALEEIIQNIQSNLIPK